jgi:hypothetical protein
VPDHPPLEHPSGVDRLLDQGVVIAQQVPEALGRSGSDRDLGDREHAGSLSGLGDRPPPAAAGRIA